MFNVHSFSNYLKLRRHWMRLVFEVPAVTIHLRSCEKNPCQLRPTAFMTILGCPPTQYPCCPASLLPWSDHLLYWSSVLTRVFFLHCHFCGSQGFSYASPRAFHEKRCYCGRRIFFHVGEPVPSFMLPRFIYKQELWVGWEQSPWMNHEWRSWTGSKISPVQKKAVHIPTKKGPSQYSSGRQHGGCDGRRPARQWG